MNISIRILGFDNSVLAIIWHFIYAGIYTNSFLLVLGGSIDTGIYTALSMLPPSTSRNKLVYIPAQIKSRMIASPLIIQHRQFMCYLQKYSSPTVDFPLQASPTVETLRLRQSAALESTFIGRRRRVDPIYKLLVVSMRMQCIQL